MKASGSHFKQNGFTLIEVLVVLSIIIMFSHFYITYQKQDKVPEVFDQFLETFEEDLFYLQQYTMTHQLVLQLYFNPTNHRYSIRHGSFNEPLLERKYAQNIQIQLNDFKNPLTFTTKGNISKPGSFYIYFDQTKYKITFVFGKGRFYVEKD